MTVVLPRRTRGQATKAACTTRRYYFDAAGWVARGIADALRAADSGCATALAHMRFLHYADEGGSLPAHTDLSRTDGDGRTSTHTFLLYLTDCSRGGETALLRCVPPAPTCPAPEADVLAVAAPRRGRLLVFPHMCPHEGRPVVSVPKLLLRGELHSRRRP